MNPGVRLVRFTLPWLVLAALVWLVWTAAGDMRDQRASAPETTATTTATGTAEATSTPVSGLTGTVLKDGVHLRDYPAPGGTVLVDLAKGATFEVIERRGTWARVRDGVGNIGWVSSDPKLVSIVQQ